MKSTSKEISPSIKNNFDKIKEQKYWEEICEPSIDIPFPPKYGYLGVIHSLVQTCIYWFHHGCQGITPEIGDIQKTAC